MIAIDEEKCVGCGQCVMLCPAEALSVWGVSKVNEEECTECMDCLYFCPNDAISEQ